MSCKICHLPDGDSHSHDHCMLPHRLGRWIVVNQDGEWRGGPFLYRERAEDRAAEFAQHNPGRTFSVETRPDADTLPGPCPQCGKPDDVLDFNRDGSVLSCRCGHAAPWSREQLHTLAAALKPKCEVPR